MSWARILHVARRQGIPVIVADSEGLQPMVLVSLEAYERFLTTQKPIEPPKGAVPIVPVPVPSPAPHARPTAPPIHTDSLRRRQRDDDRVEVLHRSLDTVSQVVREEPKTTNPGATDLLLEERFSFQS